MEAEEVMDLLNAYFPALTSPILKYDGSIDKFVGDSVLAVFGSPEPDGLQHEKAVRAALEIQTGLSEINARRAQRGHVSYAVGIGVHCGEVVHGFVGTAERMEFTVIGDPVNRTAGYCDGASAGEVLISPEVHQRVWRAFQTEPHSISPKHERDWRCFKVTGERRFT
jgi:adenylate cyclase